MDTTKLLQRIEALEKWKSDRMAQQIVFPLDIQSREILNKYFMTLMDVLLFENATGFPFLYAIAKQGNKSLVFNVASSFIRFTANSTTDYITLSQNIVSNSQGEVENNQLVLLYSTGDLPTGLLSQEYYIINSTGTTAQLSLTSGGAAVNFSSNGTGTLYLEIVNN